MSEGTVTRAAPSRARRRGEGRVLRAFGGPLRSCARRLAPRGDRRRTVARAPGARSGRSRATRWRGPGNACAAQALRWTPRPPATSSRRSSSAWVGARSASTPRTTSVPNPGARSRRSARRWRHSGSVVVPNRANSRITSRRFSKPCECWSRATASDRRSSIAEQQDFFDRHVGPWALECCAAISANPVANYYRQVAQFAHCFLALERDSFAVEE